MVSIAASAMSAAIAASFALAEPEQAEARHQHHAGQGIERLASPPTRALFARNRSGICREARDRGSRPARSLERAACGAGTISGQFLVRMV
jgi:hypothetical protein